VIHGVNQKISLRWISDRKWLKSRPIVLWFSWNGWSQCRSGSASWSGTTSGS
jgi:hypothetical protein